MNDQPPPPGEDTAPAEEVGAWLERTPEAVAAIEERRRLRDEAEAARTDAMRFDPRSWVPANDRSALARALDDVADPKNLAKLERQWAAEAESVREEVQSERRRIRSRQYMSNRPPMFETATIHDFAGTSRGEVKIRGWWDSGTRTLVIGGYQGRGKSHAAWAVCNQVAAMDRDGRAIVPVAVRGFTMHEVRALYEPPDKHLVQDETWSARRAREVRALTEADLLLLDDVTAGNVTEWMREKLHALLDARTTSEKRTIITANATNTGQTKEDQTKFGADMAARFSGPVWSRMSHGAVLAWLDGPDRRTFSDWNPFDD